MSQENVVAVPVNAGQTGDVAMQNPQPTVMAAPQEEGTKLPQVVFANKELFAHVASQAKAELQGMVNRGEMALETANRVIVDVEHEIFKALVKLHLA